MSAVKKMSVKTKKRKLVAVTHGIAHVKATFNNTLVTITDAKGNTLAWATAGEREFKGSRKSTPYAAQIAMEEAARKAKELYGLESVEVRIKGPGPGREASIRAAKAFFTVVGMYDVTGVPFNGCRPAGERRV